MKPTFTFAALCVFALSAGAAEPVKVASFSSVVTEIAAAVGGDQARVTGLIKPDIDPHEYQPTPADLRVVSESDLILTAGSEPGSYLSKVGEATGGNTNLVAVGDHLGLKPAKAHSHKHAGHPAGGEAPDPHWWHSIDNMRKATAVVRDALIRANPASEAAYKTNAKAYQASLDELERWVKRKVAELPRDRRKIVTSHDAFQYFARDHGFTIYAIQGFSTGSEPSNRHVSELIDVIERDGVKAIFVESTLNPKVTAEITRETGAKAGGALYADGLGTGAAATYAGMMKHNVSTIVDALK